jgi:hypothetical protein
LTLAKERMATKAAPYANKLFPSEIELVTNWGRRPVRRIVKVERWNKSGSANFSPRTD